MKLIHNEIEQPVLSVGEPLPGLIKDRRLDDPHQHDVEHRVVGDQNIRRRILHVPPGPHVRAIHALEELLGRGTGYELGILVDAPQFITEPSRVR